MDKDGHRALERVPLSQGTALPYKEYMAKKLKKNTGYAGKSSGKAQESSVSRYKRWWKQADGKISPGRLKKMVQALCISRKYPLFTTST